MSHLFGGGATKVVPEFTGLQVNTAVQVLPIPIIYGAPRININLIYYNDFTVTMVSQGGKGILSGGKGSKQVEYFATIMFAIGEGPLGNTQMIFQDSNVYQPADYPTNGTFYFNGTSDQAPWSYVASKYPFDSRSYKDTAYYAFPNAQLDSSATVPQIDLVVEGLLARSSPLNDSTIEVTTGQYDKHGEPVSFIGNIHLGCIDADPAMVIWDFMTNPRYGATFPSEWIDKDSIFSSPFAYDFSIGDSALSTYCQAVGLAWSVVINNVESASSIIERWCKNLNVAVVWNGQLLKFVPYYDSPSSANPGWSPINNIDMKFYMPDTEPFITVTMNDILQSSDKGDDPISFMRKDPQEVYNVARVDFRDRHNAFNDVPAEAKDEVHADLYGPRVDNIGLANEFNLGAYANVSATLQLRRNIAIMRTYTWRMGPLWAWLDPMDIINIPDPTNYNQIVTVRIVSLEEDEDENITLVAEELRVGSQAPTILPMAETTPPSWGATNSPPQAAYPPLIFEPTPDMLTAMGYATPIFVFGDSGGVDGTLDPNWGGVDVWISLDDIGYELIGTLTGPSTIGYTTGPLPGFSGANPDVADTLFVALGESNGTLDSSNASAASAGHSICVIQDVDGYEILSYTTATLSAPNTYALTGLYRGFYGTIPKAFRSGSKFMYMGTNANMFTGNLPAAYIGKDFFVKPQSFNVFKNVVQDLSEVAVYKYSIRGPVYGTTLGMSDSGATTDIFSVAGQWVMNLHDTMTASQTIGNVQSLNASLADSAMMGDYVGQSFYSVALSDFVGSSDLISP